MVLPEFAWPAEKTTALARASCSTKEHIRAFDGSVPVEDASNLHAGPCRAEMAEIEVAQNALCFAAAPGLAKSRQIIDAHRLSSKQISEEPLIYVMDSHFSFWPASLFCATDFGEGVKIQGSQSHSPSDRGRLLSIVNMHFALSS